MNNLNQLIAAFNPKRTFKCPHSTIEVDGVLVRVGGEDESTTWVPCYERGGTTPSHYRIDVEDLLQDPAQIRSARVSTGRDSLVVNEKAQGLVNYLWRDRHPTPSEGGIVFRLKVTCPIAYAHAFFQLFGSHNELSGRYGEIDGAYYTPQMDEPSWTEEFASAESEAQSLYRELCNFGVATEMSRLVHLYRFYTRFYITISLRHILEFLTIDEATHYRHTTTEFWQLKPVLLEIVKTWTPWAYEAFTKTPRVTRFDWVQTLLADAGDIRRDIGLSEANPFDKAIIRLLDVGGNDLRTGCFLDNFPDPTKGFNHASMTFFARVPIHVFRQWVRHRQGNVTELTQQFDSIVARDLFYIPAQLRKQEGKVGAYKYTDMDRETNEAIRHKMVAHQKLAVARYRRLRKSGMSEELASMILPYSFYYDFIATYPLGGLFNLLSLRTDSHAQWETRMCAQVIWPWLHLRFPRTANLFAKHTYYGDWSEILNLR